MVLGDGWIKKVNSGTSASIGMMHCARQRPFLEYKKRLLDKIFPGRSQIREINNNGYPGVVLERGSKKLLLWRRRFYTTGKKVIARQLLDWLTIEGLAIWWMDDGSLSMKRRNGKIHARIGYLSTYCTEPESRVVSEWFSTTHDINAKAVPSKGLWRIMFNTEDMKKLCPLIDPYIIPEMKYKVDMQYSTGVPARAPDTS